MKIFFKMPAIFISVLLSVLNSSKLNESEEIKVINTVMNAFIALLIGVENTLQIDNKKQVFTTTKNKFEKLHSTIEKKLLDTTDTITVEFVQSAITEFESIDDDLTYDIPKKIQNKVKNEFIGKRTLPLILGGEKRSELNNDMQNISDKKNIPITIVDTSNGNENKITTRRNPNIIDNIISLQIKKEDNINNKMEKEENMDINNNIKKVNNTTLSTIPETQELMNVSPVLNDIDYKNIIDKLPELIKKMSSIEHQNNTTSAQFPRVLDITKTDLPNLPIDGLQDNNEETNLSSDIVYDDIKDINEIKDGNVEIDLTQVQAIQL
jgi:hypothetical protein